MMILSFDQIGIEVVIKKDWESYVKNFNSIVTEIDSTVYTLSKNIILHEHGHELLNDFQNKFNIAVIMNNEDLFQLYLKYQGLVYDKYLHVGNLSEIDNTRFSGNFGVGFINIGSHIFLKTNNSETILLIKNLDSNGLLEFVLNDNNTEYYGTLINVEALKKTVYPKAFVINHHNLIGADLKIQEGDKSIIKRYPSLQEIENQYDELYEKLKKHSARIKTVEDLDF